MVHLPQSCQSKHQMVHREPQRPRQPCCACHTSDVLTATPTCCWSCTQGTTPGWPCTVAFSHLELSVTKASAFPISEHRCAVSCHSECSNCIQHPLGLDSWFCHLVTEWTWQSRFTNPNLCFPLWSRITSPCPEWAEERSKWNNLESLACLNHFGFHWGPFCLFTYFWLCWVFVALRRVWATVVVLRLLIAVASLVAEPRL